ncbi:MAG: acyltransferase [Proteobacteria bacterium]|nr:acyltransferase [Pseudomonadota bacterium]
MSVKTHRSDIDGLRAVAILGVLAYHFGLGAPGGYGGVDVFFVISGFLIAGIIKAELESGTFSLTQFYARRVRRILPALVVCIAVTSVVAAHIFFSFDLVQYGKTLASVVTATSNFAFIHKSANYFANDVSENPLLHTWSLSIEEQFYALFPLIVMLLFRYRRSALLPVMLLAGATSLAVSIYLVEHRSLRAFFSTDGRVWELLIGTVLAFGAIPQLRHRFAREGAAVLGAAMIIGCYAIYGAATPFPGLAAVPLCLGAALIIYTGTSSDADQPMPPTFVARVLSLPAVTVVGVISYSVYLWHWPLLVVVRYRFSDAFEGAALVQISLLLAALSFVLGAISWRYIEQPFRRPIAPQLRWRAFAAAAVVLLSIFAGARFVAKHPGTVQNWPPEILAVTDQNPYPLPPTAFGAKAMPGWPEETYELGRGPDEANTLLWGDSHAIAMLPGFVDYLNAHNTSMLTYVHYGCPPLMNVNLYGNQFAMKCRGLNDAFIPALLKSNIKRVVLAGVWEQLGAGRFEVSEPQKSAAVKFEPFDKVFEATVRTLLDHGKDVVIVGPLPNPNFEGAVSVARHLAWGTPLHDPETLAHFKRQDESVLALFSRLGQEMNVRVVYPHKWICNDATCPYMKERIALYLDSNHLSAAGARQLAPMYAQVFQPHYLSSAAVSDSPQ